MSPITVMSVVVDAFVDFLDIKKLGFTIKGEIKNGRPAYPAEGLLKLYYYGYLNRVRSSRRLEREARTNMEAMWLLKGLHPCFKVIADFRKDNPKAFKAAFKTFVVFLRGEGVFSDDTVATDGAKFQGTEQQEEQLQRKEGGGPSGAHRKTDGAVHQGNG